VRDGEAYKAWLDRAVTALGGCDIFIPGVSGGGGMDSEKNWVRNFEIDMLHTVRGCEALMPHWRNRVRGPLSSSARPTPWRHSRRPWPTTPSRRGSITYAKQLSQYVGKKSVRVNTVSPGPIYFEGGAWEMIKGTQAKFYDWAIKQIPCGEMGTVEEIARVIVFVASPAASLITGANIVADNGFTKRVQL
jgi:3-oxoacyl-[acyl-carrier protein] reductase